MDDDEIYVPAETPMPRWKDQWAEHVEQLGGSFVVYPIWLTTLGSVIYGIVYGISWLIGP